MSPSWAAGLIGFGIGALGTGAVASWMLRRYMTRFRAAVRRARSAERLAEIGAMTSGLAHEIKNPLSTIGLNAQLLAEGIDELPIEAEEKGRLTKRMSSLRREVERLRGILTDFLQYAGSVRLDPKPADLNLVVEELVDFFLPQAEKQGVRLRTETAPGPLIASLDVPLVKQAVLNLMINAVQAIGTHGEGSSRQGGASGGGGGGGGGASRTSGAPTRELILRTARQVDTDRRPIVTLHVIDTGPGIDEATLAKIFEPYFTTKSGGTGLGLPTARRLVEHHDGRIEVHTEPGRGTDFTVVFPALEATSRGAKGASAITPGSGGSP